MGIFNKKKKENKEFQMEIPKLPHQHVWKDMPWYMGVRYNSDERTAGYTIVEPYICITCGERKDITLEKIDWTGISPEQREQEFTKVRKRYKKYLKPRAVVEDMINNILLVKDTSYLNMVEEIRGLPHKNVGTSAEMKQVKDTEFKINLPERENK